MDDIQSGLIAICKILYNAMLRISPTKVADFIVSKGRTYGNLLAPEDAFDILSNTPVELRDGVLASIGCVLKFKKALDNNDREEFVRLCETCDNVGELLYACGYMSLYRDANITLVAPDDYSFEADKAVKNAYAVGYVPDGELLINVLRRMVRRIPDLAPYMTMEESDELDKHLLGFRSHKEYYSVILEEIEPFDPGLKSWREGIKEIYGEDSIEQQFITNYKSANKWHLPEGLANYKRFTSFFPSMPEKTHNKIYSNIQGLEQLIENVAAVGLIEDSDNAKNVFAQLILGRDLGYSSDIPLAFKEPYILCYMIAKIYDKHGYTNLKNFFIWGSLNKNGEPYDTGKQGASYAKACGGIYKDIVQALFTEKEFPFPYTDKM